MTEQLGINFGASGRDSVLSSSGISEIISQFEEGKFDCLDNTPGNGGPFYDDGSSSYYTDGCNYYDCLIGYDLFGNGESISFTFVGCYDDYAKYEGKLGTKNIVLWRAGGSYNSYANYWWIDYGKYGDDQYYPFWVRCARNNIYDPTNCDGRWNVDDRGLHGVLTGSSSCSTSTSRNINSREIITSGSNDTLSNIFDNKYSMNCSNPYGDNICIYNDGSLWKSEYTKNGNGIVSFDFLICKDDNPAFMYKYTNDNTSITYILHYESFENKWLLSKNTISDLTGESFCIEEDLTKCTYNKWFVKQISNDTIVDYIIDESMGYDPDCQFDTTNNDDNDDGYCGKWDACALWTAEYTISDSSSTTNICNDGYFHCISSLLNNDFSIATINKQCDSEYSIDVTFNVSFSGSGGYESYNLYVSEYESIFKFCDGNNTQLDINFIESSLLVCDGCNFGSNTQESCSPRLMWIVGVYVVAVMATMKI